MLYLLGCALIFSDQLDERHFLASPAQLTGAAGVAAALVAAALLVGRRPAPTGERRVPRPVPLGVGAFVTASVFFGTPETWLGVVLDVVVLAAAAVAVAHWSRQRGWWSAHRFALAAGALLTYAWGGFVLTALIEPGDPVRWAGNAVFAVAAVALLAVVGRRIGGRVDRRVGADRPAGR
jgi:hypothetical protein